MQGNCCKQKIENNEKIKLTLLLDVKEYTSIEGPTNCNAATSTTRQCNNNDNNNNIKERLAWSDIKERGRSRLVIKVRRRKKSRSK